MTKHSTVCEEVAVLPAAQRHFVKADALSLPSGFIAALCSAQLTSASFTDCSVPGGQTGFGFNILYNPRFHHHLSTVSLDRLHQIVIFQIPSESHLPIITPSIHLPGLSLFCISSHCQQNQTLVLVTTQQESCSFSQLPSSELPFPKHPLSPQLPT